MSFDINNFALHGLRDNPFDGQAIRDLWEHLVKFYETYSVCKPTDVTDDQVKLCLFGFSLIGRVKDLLKCLPNGTIQTWKGLEDKFLEIYYSNAQFVERKAAISNFSQEESESLSDA